MWATAFFVGLIVGLLVGFAFFNSKQNVKAAVTVLGAILGGIPVAYLGSASTFWAYPFGILWGLVAVRIVSARMSVAKAFEPMRSAQDIVHAFFGGVDLILIALGFVISVGYALYLLFV